MVAADTGSNSVSAFDYARESIRAIHITPCEEGEWIPNRFVGHDMKIERLECMEWIHESSQVHNRTQPLRDDSGIGSIGSSIPVPDREGALEARCGAVGVTLRCPKVTVLAAPQQCRCCWGRGSRG